MRRPTLGYRAVGRGGGAPAATEAVLDRKQFATALAHRFVLRGHMALMLLAVVLSGIVTSKLLLLLGLGSMRMRYGVTVIAAYMLFVGLVGLWLMYVRRVTTTGTAAAATPRSSTGIGNIELDFLPIGSGSGSGGGPSPLAPGGGTFGGGGASGTFDDPGSGSARSSTTSSGSSGRGSGGKSGGSWGLGGDLDDGVWIVIAFIVFVAIVAVSAGWVIYDAPSMFGEAAFEFFLASGLIRGARAWKMGGGNDLVTAGWTGVVLKRTAIPFLIVVIAAVTFGHVTQRLCPGARSVVQAFQFCVAASERP